MKFYVSTFSCLLEAEVCMKDRQVESRVLDDARPIYFGITRCGDGCLAVARNLDMEKSRVIEGPTNGLLSVDEGGRVQDWWSCDKFDDLHQIRLRGDRLYVLNGRRPQLVILDLHEGQRRVSSEINLDQYVPRDLRHPALERHPGDNYHFNSLHFGANGLWVLAHNWGFGSFALRFGIDGLLRGKPKLLECRRGLGYQSHDVFEVSAERDGLRAEIDVISSAEMRIIRSGGNPGAQSVAALPQSRGFARGLSVTKEYYVVGVGAYSDDRAGRLHGESTLVAFRRDQIFAEGEGISLSLGPYGNICDVLSVEDEDVSDSGSLT